MNTFPTQILALEPYTIILNLVLALFASLLIALVYKKTHKGLSYSQTFVITLVLSGLIIAAVMMVIGNNIARAFGAFGAFSLIRFRTAIKDAKDMGFIFLVLAVGMAMGTNNYFIGVLTTIIALLTLIILQKINFGSLRQFDYLLNFDFDAHTHDEAQFRDVFSKYLRSQTMLHVKALEGGKTLQMSFSVKFIKDDEAGAFTQALRAGEGIHHVNLITAKNDVEY